MSRLKVTDLSIKGLKLIERQSLGDARGYLARLFCAEELRPAGWSQAIAQVNYTHTAKKGTLRGMHYQRKPYAEMKLVSCIRGEVFDVAVDLRVESDTFLKVYTELLSPDSGKALLIPEGFAHGFQALTDDVEMVYCHSMVFTPEAEAGLCATDKLLNIKWPLPITEISQRDQSHPSIQKNAKGFIIL
jgi:dTDP-4-dehydrorhamnose 3,5-epimerase